jgi:hypothetical protein
MDEFRIPVLPSPPVLEILLGNSLAFYSLGSQFNHFVPLGHQHQTGQPNK